MRTEDSVGVVVDFDQPKIMQQRLVMKLQAWDNTLPRNKQRWLVNKSSFAFVEDIEAILVSSSLSLQTYKRHSIGRKHLQ